jgi:hypothetical protein
VHKQDARHSCIINFCQPYSQKNHSTSCQAPFAHYGEIKTTATQLAENLLTIFRPLMLFWKCNGACLVTTGGFLGGLPQFAAGSFKTGTALEAS